MWQFTRGEWDHAARFFGKRGRCRDCMAWNAEQKKCIRCGTAKKQTEFSAGAWQNPADRVCTMCTKKPAEQKKCTKCGEEQGQAAFSDKAWRSPKQRTCKTCVSNSRGLWKCCHCQELKPKAEFSSWLEGRTAKTWLAAAWCNPCRQGSIAEQQQVAVDSSAAVLKRKREP